MRILFLRPAPSSETIGLQHVMIVEPLELEILATLVADDNEVTIVDLILETKPLSYFIDKIDPDIVCATGYITHIDQMLEICIEAKKINKNIVTIVGGVYIEKVPESIDNVNVDYRVVRNATQSFPQLISYIKGAAEFPSGALRSNEPLNEAALPPYNFSTPIPNRSLTQNYRSKYFYVFHNKVALIKTSFGCPFPCLFCFCRKITGDNYFERPLEDIIKELKTINEKEVYIVDDNFLVSEQRVKNFIELLKEHKIRKKYLIYGRADFIASHPELMQEFKRHGLRTIIVGFESFNDEELVSLNKNSIARTNEIAMKILNNHRIDCYASVIAMPNWDREDFKKITKKLIELKIRFINIQPLTPLEKTDMVFDEKDLLIERTEFAKWDLAHVVIQPQKLSLHDYYDEILRMYLKILFRPSNLIHHFKYSIFMQIKLFVGAYKVKRQYKKKIAESI